MVGLFDTALAPYPRGPGARTPSRRHQAEPARRGASLPRSTGVTLSILIGVGRPAIADAFEELRRFVQGAGGPGVYLTDEVFLYRLVDLVALAQDDVAELEDCYLLDVVHVSLSDLRARPLRVVTPVPTGSALGERPLGQ
jgi:hypothetical protein